MQEEGRLMAEEMCFAKKRADRCVFWSFFLCLFACDESRAQRAESPPVETVSDAVVAPVAPESNFSPSGWISVFDLVDNRHLAHVLEGGLVIDVGSARALKYVQGRWNSGWLDAQREGDRFFAHVRGVKGEIRFPLLVPDGGGALELSIRLRPVGAQRCDLFIRAPGRDEKKFASLTSISAGWKTYTVSLPNDLVIGQEHTLRLHFSRSRSISGGRKSAAAIDWIRLGRSLSDGEPAGSAVDVDRFEKGKDKEKTLTLASGQSLSWFTALPAGSRFLASVKPGKPATFTVRDEQGVQRFSSDRGGLDVDLSAYAGKTVEMSLHGPAPVKGSERPKPAVFERPRVAVKERDAQKWSETPQIVLVWIVDTLRADHLAVYNPKTTVQTPHLDRLAESSALFLEATVQGNSSLPTSASIFTSQYPPRHGLIRESGRLATKEVLLAEPFRQHGFRTGLFSSNGYVSKRWGFARGFEKEVNPIRESSPADTEYLWPQAKKWMEGLLAADPKTPIFVYINTVDPHVPYDPPDQDLALYHPSKQRIGRIKPRGTGELLHDMAKKSVTLTTAERNYLRALYRAEITYNDRWLKRMLDDLESLGVREKTLIAVTSDHGEEFGEYGRYGHGVSVNQELVDVPFLLHFSPWTGAGARIQTSVEIIDLYPTLLDSVGLAEKTPAGVQGISLLPFVRDPTPHLPVPAFAYHNDFLRSARLGDLKYQLFHGDRDPVYVLDGYDPAGNDRRDVGPQKPVARRALRDLMAFHLAMDTTWKKSRDGRPNNHTERLAAELDERGWNRPGRSQ
jgi:choline-sulfatase